MTCGSCGTLNREGRKFCSGCGASLGLACTACGTANEPGERFCGECGTALAVPAAPSRPRAPEPAADRLPELRRVSVVFCDLVGYTALSEQRDAEDVRTVLSGYFDVARTVVGRYGGVLEKYIGDAVMAVWGAPAAHEDDAERATRAALDLVDGVAAYGETLGLPLRARAGVVTGRAASITNPLEGIVVGDRVNTAARVQSLAEPGTVLVDAGTHDVTAAAISYADAGVHSVKGKVEPLHLWRAERVVAGIRGDQRIDGLEAPMVGRTHELTVVKELFHACLEERRARLVALTGPPGAGKSRLFWEFEKYVDGVVADVLWHSGRCLAYGDGVAYWALAEMVRQRLGVAQDDPADVVREKLRAGMDRWVVDPEARAYVEPRVGVLLGFEDAAFSRSELFAGWRLLLEQLAEEAPVVLAFEDLQWADPGLLDFLEQLLDWSSGHAIFVLAVARSELFDARPGLLAGRRNATTVNVEPLPAAAVGALLDHLVPGLPDRVRQLVVRHADGMPLYVVETIRGLIDRGLVEAREGDYTLVGEVDELQVPASLTALLGARLDSLPPDGRTLVRDLCVFGGSFPRSAVDGVTDLPPDAVEAALADLVRRDVLAVRRDRLSPDRGHYAFVQALFRTVAYEGLSKRERKVRHVRAAAHLRTAFADSPEEVVEVVARHYRDAWSAAPDDPDAADLRALAAEAFGSAGDRARSVGAPRTAEQAYLEAAALTPDEPAAAGWLTLAADMALLAGRYAAAVELYDEVAERHRRAGRDGALRDLVLPCSRALGFAGRPDEAERRLREAVATAGEDDPVSAPWVRALGTVAWLRGDSAAAQRYSDRALALAAAAGDPRALALAAGTRADALVGANRLDEALLLYRWSLDLLGPDGDGLQRMRLLINLGGVMADGDLPGSRAPLEGAVELGRRLGDIGYTLAVANLAVLDLFVGDWDAAEQRLLATLAELPVEDADGGVTRYALVLVRAHQGHTDEATQLLGTLGAWAGSPDVQLRTIHDQASGQVAAVEGDDETALARCAAGVRAAIPEMGFRVMPVRFGWPLALEAALELGRLDEARELFALVADAPSGFVPPFLQAQVSRYRARLAAAEGRREGVERDLREAVEALDRLGYPYWAALARADLADALDSEGRPEEAAAERDAAVATLGGLGAGPALRRLGVTPPGGLVRT
jgi:class 3 adenylate cyclase/tetratricopeptide (TPR) repeat protein